MKKSLFALSAAMLMGCTLNFAHASAVAHPNHLIQNDEPQNTWTLVQESYGVQVSFSIVSVEQERFLSVQFVNTNAESTDFIWSMTKNTTPVIITADEMIESRIQLAANATETVDGTYLVYLDDADQLSDFVISIQPSKH